jgi:hypothetical protein
MRLYQRAVVATAVCLAAGAAGAQTTVYTNDFSSSTTAPGGTFTASNRDQAGSGAVGLALYNNLGQQSLGMTGRTFWDQLVTLTMDPTLAATSGTVSFRIYIWDTWDGFNCCGPDRVSFNINGGPALMDDLFVDRVPDDGAGGRRGYDYSFAFGPLAGGSQFNWVGDPTQADEGWTLDDVQVRMNLVPAQSTVPEPGTWVMLATGLLAVGGVAARRSRAG